MIRIQSLEKHVHKWTVFALNLIELWQNIQHDTRKLKLKKIRLSKASEDLPRLVDMLFQVKNEFYHQPICFNDKEIIMSFCEEHTTIRIILCTHFKVSSNTSIEQQETKEFHTDIKQLIDDCPLIEDKIETSCINNVNINDINAFICIQPAMQITKNNSNSQPLLKLTFSSS